MSNNSDERLEKLLRSRRVQPARDDLAARIIAKAQSLPQLQNLSLWQGVRQLFAEFHLPKPGYVLAGALLLGILLGFDGASENGQPGESNGVISYNYIAGEEGLL